MKKKIVSIALVLSMLVGILAMMSISVGAAEPDLDKDGNVYLIKSLDDWTVFAGNSDEGWTGSFRLEADLDFSGVTYAPVRNFTGTFDGNGHTISGITYESDNESGMFRCTGGEKVVKNFVLTNSTFKGAKWVGAIFCDTNDNTTISNVYVTNSVTVHADNGYVGGFVGGLGTKGHRVTIKNSVFAGTVTSGSQYGGGFIGNGNSQSGKLRSIEIDTCLMMGSVSTTKTSSPRTSGFFGYNYLSNTDVKDNTLKNVIKNSIYAGIGTNNYSQFGDGDNMVVQNCYTINGEGKMWCDDYNGGDHKLEDDGTGVTLIEGGMPAIIGLDAAISSLGWTKREGDIIVPDGVADFAPDTSELWAASCTVIWKNGEEILDEETYNYGDVPTYKGEAPTKADDDVYTYTFVNWTPEVSAVTGDITYYAEFIKVRKGIVIDDEEEEENGGEQKPNEESADTSVHTAPETEAVAEGGCGASIGIAGVALVALASGAALVIRKKED